MTYSSGLKTSVRDAGPTVYEGRRPSLDTPPLRGENSRIVRVFRPAALDHRRIKSWRPRARRPKVKKTKHLTLRDRLSRLTYARACQLLGPSGAQLIREGSNYEIDLERDVYLRGDLFRVKFSETDDGKNIVASITTMAAAGNRLKFNCTACETMCRHVGAAVSLVLEDKTALGLAAPPDENLPLELLSESELHPAGPQRTARAGQLRKVPHHARPIRQKPWTDYTVASALSGKTYRVALRGEERGQSFCSCPDFRTNTLGTCKHVLHLLGRVRRRFPAAQRQKPYRNRETFVHVLYGEETTLHLQLPDKPDAEVVASPASWPTARSTTCGSWSSSWARWSGWTAA